MMVKTGGVPNIKNPAGFRISREQYFNNMTSHIIASKFTSAKRRNKPVTLAKVKSSEI